MRHPVDGRRLPHRYHGCVITAEHIGGDAYGGRHRGDPIQSVEQAEQRQAVILVAKKRTAGISVPVRAVRSYQTQHALLTVGRCSACSTDWIGSPRCRPPYASPPMCSAVMTHRGIRVGSRRPSTGCRIRRAGRRHAAQHAGHYTVATMISGGLCLISALADLTGQAGFCVRPGKRLGRR